MPRAKRVAQETDAKAKETTTFQVDATVYDDGLFFRHGLVEGTAKVPGLGNVRTELSVNIGGGDILVDVHYTRKGKIHWRTFAISAEELIRQAIAKVQNNPPRGN